jgi:hypothetical protein
VLLQHDVAAVEKGQLRHKQDRLLVVVVIAILMVMDDVAMGAPGIEQLLGPVTAGQKQFSDVTATQSKVIKNVAAKRVQLFAGFASG